MSFPQQESPGLQAAAFPGPRHPASFCPHSVILKMQNLWEKENSSSSAVTHSRIWPPPSLCHFRWGHQKDFIKELDWALGVPQRPGTGNGHEPDTWCCHRLGVGQTGGPAKPWLSREALTRVRHQVLSQARGRHQGRRSREGPGSSVTSCLAGALPWSHCHLRILMLPQLGAPTLLP